EALCEGRTGRDGRRGRRGAGECRDGAGLARAQRRRDRGVAVPASPRVGKDGTAACLRPGQGRERRHRAGRGQRQSGAEARSQELAARTWTQERQTWLPRMYSSVARRMRTMKPRSTATLV